MADWNNRIVGEGSQKASEFLAHPMNWRRHPKHQREALKAVLDDVGWVQRVIVNRNTGFVVDGHERIWQAMQNGDAEVPYLEVELDEAEEKLILATLDPISALAETDNEKLNELLQSVNSDSRAIQEMLADLAGPPLFEPPEDQDPQIDKAEELRKKWGVELGQLWKLGMHKLICGDCTDGAVVGRVMDGERADLTLTDPPYGISVVPACGNIGWSTKNAKVSSFRQIQNDDKVMDIGFLLETAKQVVIFGGNYHAHYLPKAGRWLVWDKDFTDNERGFVPFSECELIWTNIDGVAVKKYKCRSMGYSREGESGSRHHPTQKPVKVIVGIAEDFTGADAIIYDPFLGSGTTLIACERLGRKCRAVEIDPGYCAVAIQRWVDMTGGEPELIDATR